MSFCSEIEVDSDPEGTDCLMNAPLSPVFPSQTNEKKKPNENIEISSAGESKEFLLYISTSLFQPSSLFILFFGGQTSAFYDVTIPFVYEYTATPTPS